MKRILVMLVIAIVAISSPAFSGGAVGLNEINKVAFQSGGFFLYTDGWSNPNDCQRSDAVVLLDDGPNYDKAYALVLAAYMAGKKVNGYSDRCVTFDEKTYNMIRGHKYLTVE